MSGGDMVGALFANYLMDDQYATRFAQAYLPKGTEVVFYTKDSGVYGDSFSDPKTRRLVNSYFNSGSEWIKDGASDRTISIGSGHYYFIENVVFPGLESSPGGALIFVPRADLSNAANMATALLVLLVFIILSVIHHVRSRGEEKGWRYWVTIAFIILPVAALSFSALHIQNTGILKLEYTPYTLYNSTLHIDPESGIYDMGYDQRFSVLVDTGDEPINAVKVGIKFDPQAVDIKALDTASSSCSYVIENRIDEKLGEAYLSCVILDSKIGRRSFSVANILATPKHPGNFELSFDNAETAVFAADGIGTDVLRIRPQIIRRRHFNYYRAYFCCFFSHTPESEPLV
jgi:hypothetical protein